MLGPGLSGRAAPGGRTFSALGGGEATKRRDGGLGLPVRVTGVQDTVWDVNTGSGWLQGQRCRAASVRGTGYPLSAHPRLWPPYLDVKAAVLRDLK